MATSKQQLEVHKEDHHTPSKWSVSLGEEVFRKFVGQANSAVQTVFGDGSLFSPLLFGKFFDPADAFPLWEFESDLLLSNLRISGKSSVDWFQIDQEYVLQAELLGNFFSLIRAFLSNFKYFRRNMWVEGSTSNFKVDSLSLSQLSYICLR